MKEKIRLALVNKYKNLGFSDKAIDGILAYLESTITSEDQIDAGVAGVEGMLKAFQAEADRRATEAAAKAKEKPADPPTPQPAPTPNDPPVDPNMPEWAKTFMQSISAKVDTVASEVGAIKAKDSAGSRKAQLEEVLKDAPEAYKNTILKNFARMNFEKDEDFNSYRDEVKEDLPAYVQTEANNGLSKLNKPVVPTGGNQVKQASPDQVKAIFNKAKPK